MAIVTLNSELNGIEVSFESKPETATLDALKSNGFRWHRVKKIWYAKNTAERLALVQSFGATAAPAPVSAPARLSLWDRCKTDDIPEHDRHADTKTIAAETRKHIKSRFPEIKFSCRIGSGGWAACNEVNFYFQSAPFAKDSAYFEAVKAYVEAWLDSFNYNHSDYMSDYFDVNFYSDVSSWDFSERPATDEEKQDLADFDTQAAAAEIAKREREESEFLAWQEQEKAHAAAAEALERERILNIETVTAAVDVVDVPEKYILTAPMISGIGKEPTVDRIRERGTEREESALIARELHFTDRAAFDLFCNMLLDDFDFLKGYGGTGTLDKRVNDENLHQLNRTQLNQVEFILWDSIAVFVDGKLELIVNPEGYNYARYCYIVTGDASRVPLEDAEKAEAVTEREPFHFPSPVADQFPGLQVGGKYTLVYNDPWTMSARMEYITLTAASVQDYYAQYPDSLHIEYTPAGKRRTDDVFIHNGSSALIYPGFVPPLPEDMTKRKINEHMSELLSAGRNVGAFMVSVARYYAAQGIAPVIDTLQY